MKIKKIAQTPGLVATVVDNLNSTSTTDALSANQGKVLNENKLDKTLISKSLSTAGWYRVAKVSNNYGAEGGSCIVNIRSVYNNTENMSATILVNVAYQNAKLINSNVAIKNNTLNKARIVAEGSNYYLEIYYAINVYNNIYVDILTQSYCEMLDFEAPISSATVLDTITISNTEGTFTPYLSGENGTGTGQYNIQNGYYKKIGNIVFYQFQIGCTSFTGMSGYLLVQGLPFSIDVDPNLGNLITEGTIFDSSKTYHTRRYANGLLIEPNSSMSAINNIQINSQHYIYGSGFYFTNE